MKRSQLFVVRHSIEQVLQSSKNTKLNYALIKNKKMLDKEIDIWKELNKPDEKYDEYIQKMKDLRRDHSAKDMKGTPKVDIATGDFEIDTLKSKEYDKKVVELTAEYKPMIEANNDKMKQFDKFLNEETDKDVTYFKIKLADIPNDIVLGAYMDVLFDLIISE